MGSNRFNNCFHRLDFVSTFLLKDLSKNLNNLYLGYFFAAIWFSYYLFIITKSLINH
jgi:hypothetical protein